MAEILNTGFQRSGKGSRISVAGQALYYARFQASWEAEDLDTVNFGSYNAPTDQTLDEGIMGVESSAFSGGGDWPANQVPFVPPPGIFPRDDLADLALILNVNDDQEFNYPFARIRSANCSTAVRDKVTFEFSGKNQGVFLVPTINVS